MSIIRIRLLQIQKPWIIVVNHDSGNMEFRRAASGFHANVIGNDMAPGMDRETFSERGVDEALIDLGLEFSNLGIELAASRTKGRR